MIFFCYWLTNFSSFIILSVYFSSQDFGDDLIALPFWFRSYLIFICFRLNWVLPQQSGFLRFSREKVLVLGRLGLVPSTTKSAGSWEKRAIKSRSGNETHQAGRLIYYLFYRFDLIEYWNHPLKQHLNGCGRCCG